jgi:hypothetical protein
VPLGWVDQEQPGAVLPLGDVFDPGTGSLQDALNASLTSPVGLAVAVTRGTGRYAGVLSAAEIVAAAVEQRTAAVRAGLESAAAAATPAAEAEVVETVEAEAAEATSPRSPEVVAEADQDTAIRPADEANEDTVVAPIAPVDADVAKPGTTVARRAQSTVDKVRPGPDDDAKADAEDREPAVAGGGR